MRIIKATWFATIGVLLSLFVVGAAWALPPRVSWEPARLAPASLAPGESATYSVTLIHTGFLPIPATKQLRIVPEGAIARYVNVIPPNFPPVLKRGARVSVQVTVTAPPNTPFFVVRDELLLERVLPNGKTLEVFRAEALPVELTFSSIALPPDPGEAGKATLEGIDSNGNGVRDDIERWIAFTYVGEASVLKVMNDAAIVRGASIQSGQAKDRERAMDMSRQYFRITQCLDYLIADRAFDSLMDLTARHLDTANRSAAYSAYEDLISGSVSDYYEPGPAACSQ